MGDEPIKLVPKRVAIQRDIAENLRVWNQLVHENGIKAIAIVGVEPDGATRLWWHHGEGHKVQLMGALEVIKWRMMEEGGEIQDITTEGKDFDDDGSKDQS